MVQALYNDDMATGSDHSEDKLSATKINLQRMKRLDKTTHLSVDLLSELDEFSENWKWTLILEGWCGDGAQIAPYINKITEFTAGISLRIILRDENPEIMDQHLTNGTRSIPVLICENVNTNTFVGKWGPRPKAVLEWVESFKENNPNYTSTEFKEQLHLFYTKDKGNSIYSDLLESILKWKKTDKNPV
jgi:hypothetical protein